MESLGKIFGSNHRVKIMRLFLFNESTAFDIDDITDRSKVKKTEARKEINALLKIGFLKKKQFSKKVTLKKRNKEGKIQYKKNMTKGWVLNKRFDLIEPLKKLLIDSELIKEKEINSRLRKAGTIQLLLLSGIFTRDDNRKLDLLIVGKKLKKDILEKEISVIESEIGRELRYAFFDASEFNYRVSMYDKLIRDVLENNHIKAIYKMDY